MDKMKQWVAFAVLGALVIGVGGWFLLISPKRAHAADLSSQADAKRRANAVLVNRLAVLKAQQKDLPKQQAQLAAVAAKIPNNSAMPTLIRVLNGAAEDVGVELVSLSPGAPSPLAVSAPATTVSTPAAAGAATPTAPNAAAGAAAVGTLNSIPVTLNVVGSYFQVAQYFDRLENLTRAFRVTGFTLAPGQNPVKPVAGQPSSDSGKVLTAAISGLVFDTTGATTPTTTVAGK